jgi:suppressor for copper-sensitivity B
MKRKDIYDGVCPCALGQPGVVRMRADWSQPNPSIANYLESFGRYGIPLDVVYGPRRPQREALPELLTPGILFRALDQASSNATASTLSSFP